MTTRLACVVPFMHDEGGAASVTGSTVPASLVAPDPELEPPDPCDPVEDPPPLPPEPPALVDPLPVPPVDPALTPLSPGPPCTPDVSAPVPAVEPPEDEPLCAPPPAPWSPPTFDPGPVLWGFDEHEATDKIETQPSRLSSEVDLRIARTGELLNPRPPSMDARVICPVRDARKGQIVLQNRPEFRIRTNETESTTVRSSSRPAHPAV